jgi:hypothetical protein
VRVRISPSAPNTIDRRCYNIQQYTLLQSALNRNDQGAGRLIDLSLLLACDTCVLSGAER